MQLEERSGSETPVAERGALREPDYSRSHACRRRVRSVSIVIPAFEEEAVIGRTVRDVIEATRDDPDASYEVLVIDDGSHDLTYRRALEAGARVVSHPYNIGNGAAIKTGIRNATGDAIVFMDGDGQHRAESLPEMIRLLDDYHMVVGARDRAGQAHWARAIANGVYNRFATYVTGFKVQDLTSGFRAMRAADLRRFTYLLPNKFSYPTTITLAMLRAGLPVRYVPIKACRRTGKSKIRPMQDGVRFLIIMMKIATLFAPLRIFIPLAAAFLATGLGYYGYTFLTERRFTNMGLLLVVLAFLTFSLGLISEQVAQLRYDRSEE